MKSLAEIYSNVGLTMFLETFEQARDSQGRFASDDESDDDPEDVVGLKDLAQESRSKIARLKSKLASEHDRGEKARLKSQLEIEMENLEDLENQISFAKNYRG